MGPSRSLPGNGRNYAGLKNIFFFPPVSLHLDWHLTETCWPIPFISSLKEMISAAGNAHQYLWTDQLEFSLNPY